ncbi:hypothetical protein [Endozoicomonas atrinae]|uniref:hypothetical protein n=1 Tax=Endozoicomonas atrinae TaxID=1333660 RepID=UPI000824507E|nr:hypothetical protein [Endozoicomonas atrinae]
MYDIEGLTIILNDKNIPGLAMPLLQIKDVDDCQWHPFSLEDCNLLRNSWVGRNLSDHIRSIKYAMSHLDSNMSKVQLKLNPEGSLFLKLSFNYSYGDVWHVLLPLNYQDSDGGRTQFLLEMYLRFGTEFMVRAFSNYGRIQGVLEPDLYISEVSGGGRPFISLSLIMLVKVGGQTVTVQTRLKNPEELYFLDWKEPDVKVVNWKDFFDQFKKR